MKSQNRKFDTVAILPTYLVQKENVKHMQVSDIYFNDFEICFVCYLLLTVTHTERKTEIDQFVKSLLCYIRGPQNEFFLWKMLPDYKK